MTFKDKSNRACNQTGQPGQTVHLSNLCTEILEVTHGGETAVCNLGSINLARHVGPAGFDFEQLAHTVEVALRQLDRVIDLNYYPHQHGAASNMRWRPVGLGLMGLQDVFFGCGCPSTAPQRGRSRPASSPPSTSTRCALTRNWPSSRRGMMLCADPRAAAGELQFDAWV